MPVLGRYGECARVYCRQVLETVFHPDFMKFVRLGEEEKMQAERLAQADSIPEKLGIN